MAERPAVIPYRNVMYAKLYRMCLRCINDDCVGEEPGGTLAPAGTSCHS